MRTEEKSLLVDSDPRLLDANFLDGEIVKIRKARSITAWLILLFLWNISPALITQEAPGKGLFIYSPDRKYKIQVLKPGPWTPWVLWQYLSHDCVMFIRLYNNKTGEMIGQTSWFNFMECYDLLGTIIWPGQLKPANEYFSIGDRAQGFYWGADIAVDLIQR